MYGIFNMYINRKSFLEALDVLEAMSSEDFLHCVDDALELLVIHATNQFLVLISKNNLQGVYFSRIALIASMNEHKIESKNRMSLSEYLWRELICELNRTHVVGGAIIATCFKFLLKYDPEQKDEKAYRLLFTLLNLCPSFEMDPSLEILFEEYGIKRYIPLLKLFRGVYAETIEELLLSQEDFVPLVFDSILSHQSIEVEAKKECLKCFASLRCLSLLSPSCLSLDINSYEAIYISDGCTDDYIKEIIEVMRNSSTHIDNTIAEQDMLNRAQRMQKNLEFKNAIKAVLHMISNSAASIAEQIHSANVLKQQIGDKVSILLLEICFLQLYFKICATLSKTIRSDEICQICKSDALDALNPEDIYAFPCSHVVHCSCIYRRLNQYYPLEIATEGMSCTSATSGASAFSIVTHDSDKVEENAAIAEQRIDRLLSSDCPFCGRYTQESISLSLLTDEAIQF